MIDENGVTTVSASECNTWMQCNQEWHYKYVLRIWPMQDDPRTWHGSAWDKALKILETGGSHGDAVESLYHSPLQETDCRVLEMLLVAWQTKYGPIKQLQSASQKFFLTSLMVRGEFDGVADDGMVLIEHKLTRESVEAGSVWWDRRVIDTQTSIYAAAQSHMYLGDKQSIIVDATNLPTISRQLATPIESRRFRVKDGGIYKGQREQDEPIDEWLARIEQSIVEKSDQMFQRKTLTASSSEIDCTKSRVASIVNQMSQAFGYMPVRNGHSCWRFGRWCPYRDICLGYDSLDSARFEYKKGWLP
jgi:hypothetical protein